MMFSMNRDSESRSSSRTKRKFKVGDRVTTSNRCLGTVVRIDRDEVGEYVVARLDILPGEFAYDPWDLDKVD
jgi:preprotein translocase subunit YajC